MLLLKTMLKEDWALYGFIQVGSKKPRPGTGLKFWVDKKGSVQLSDIHSILVGSFFLTEKNIDFFFPRSLTEQHHKKINISLCFFQIRSLTKFTAALPIFRENIPKI